MSRPCNRRRFLGATAGLALASPALRAVGSPRSEAPTAPVALAKCKTYDEAEVRRSLDSLFENLGGLSKLVTGKTVTVKVNLTGDPKTPALGRTAIRTFQIHPSVVHATASLLDAAGAKRIKFVEGIYRDQPIENVLRDAGWDLNALLAHKARVEFEDTRNLGSSKSYAEVKVPWGGGLFPSYLLNRSYVDCDVYVSLAKLKNHATAGITLAIKNNFGITPTAIYGQTEQDERSTGNRVATFHEGRQKAPAGVPQELDPASPRRPTHRVPLHTVDSVGIRPIDLSILDGIETVSGGEGPWLKSLAIQDAGVLIAGLNPVCTDAVGTAVMGYDPIAPAGTGPFPAANHLAMAAALGVGTHDLSRIEVRGRSIADCLHPFGWQPTERG